MHAQCTREYDVMISATTANGSTILQLFEFVWWVFEKLLPVMQFLHFHILIIKQWKKAARHNAPCEVICPLETL